MARIKRVKLSRVDNQRSIKSIPVDRSRAESTVCAEVESVDRVAQIFPVDRSFRSTRSISSIGTIVPSYHLIGPWLSEYNRSRQYPDRATIFTALHGMQTRSSDSVCPSVSQTVICDNMEERSVQIFMLYEKSFSLVFWEEEWLVRATPSTWNFGSTSPRWSEIADFVIVPIFTRSASAVTPSEESSINTNRKSRRAFQWA